MLKRKKRKPKSLSTKSLQQELNEIIKFLEGNPLSASYNARYMEIVKRFKALKILT